MSNWFLSLAKAVFLNIIFEWMSRMKVVIFGALLLILTVCGIASSETSNLGDTSTLLNPEVVEKIMEEVL